MGRTEELRVLLVGDTQGNDDEGMKRIARQLSAALQGECGIVADVVSVREATNKLDSVDIVHYVAGPSYRSVLFAAWCKRRNRQIRTILTFTNPRWGLVADAAIRLFTPDSVLVQSNSWRQWAIRWGAPFRMIPVSGVDLDRFRSVSVERRNQLRREFDFPLDEMLVLHVGHLKSDRNLHVLLDVQSQPGLQVVVVGSTTTIHSKGLVRCLEQAGCRVFRTYQPKVEQLYQAVDCYVFPTEDTRAAIQIPLSVLEAMATNLPVITTPFGGLPYYFPRSLGLYYITPAQYPQLPEIIRSSSVTPSKTESLVLEFSWRSIAKRLHRMYLELMES